MIDSRAVCSLRQIAVALISVTVCLQVMWDFIGHLDSRKTLNNFEASKQLMLAAWPTRSFLATKMGLILFARAHSYGDTTVEGSSPSIEAALQDEDDEEDAELDASATESATNDYPDEADADDEDSFGEESRQVASWGLILDPDRGPESITAAESRSQLARLVKAKTIWSGLDGWRGRDRRDSDDGHRLPNIVSSIFGHRSVIPTNKARHVRAPIDPSETKPAASTKITASLDNNKDEDFAIDDGDEDAWVHDGIDDIHIDPETKRAASELGRDNESTNLDLEYEPNGHQSDLGDTASVSNDNDNKNQAIEGGRSDRRDQMGEFARVISLNKSGPSQSSLAQASSRNDWSSNGGTSADFDSDTGDQRANNIPLPAAYLTTDQIKQLIRESANHSPMLNGRRQGEDEDEEDERGHLNGQRQRLIVVVQ